MDTEKKIKNILNLSLEHGEDKIVFVNDEQLNALFFPKNYAFLSYGLGDMASQIKNVLFSSQALMEEVNRKGKLVDKLAIVEAMDKFFPKNSVLDATTKQSMAENMFHEARKKASLSHSDAKEHYQVNMVSGLTSLNTLIYNPKSFYCLKNIKATFRFEKSGRHGKAIFLNRLDTINKRMGDTAFSLRTLYDDETIGAKDLKQFSVWLKNNYGLTRGNLFPYAQRVKVTKEVLPLVLDKNLVVMLKGLHDTQSHFWLQPKEGVEGDNLVFLEEVEKTALTGKKSRQKPSAKTPARSPENSTKEPKEHVEGVKVADWAVSLRQHTGHCR